MKKVTTLISLLFIISLPVYSEFSFQPVVGYERVQKFTPTVHTKDRAVVGARVLYGPPIFSLEAEVTRGEDTENFASRNLKITEEAYTGKIGFRSSLSLVFASWFLRAGGNARKRKITETSAGVTTEKEPAMYVSPYAGTGLSVNILGKFTANAGVTVIFTGRPKGSDREYQTTLGFGVKI